MNEENKNEENTGGHYVCTGSCGGVSDKPGVCQAEGCPKYHQELEPCDCTDGEHANSEPEE